MSMLCTRHALPAILSCTAWTAVAAGQSVGVVSELRITEGESGFTGDLDFDRFGGSLANLGDLDGDGVVDVAVGAYVTAEAGVFHGCVWILFLNGDGTVKAQQKISSLEGGFTGDLESGDTFGFAVASLGDLDGNGTTDLAVGATGDDDGGLNRGAVWILFLDTDGTVLSHQKISDTEGGFTGVLADQDHFGRGLGNVGDLDGDGLCELAVGQPSNRGSVWILFLNADGTVASHQHFGHGFGGFGGLPQLAYFGSDIANLGDIDGDGVVDLAVTAPGQDAIHLDPPPIGRLYIVFLNADGTVKDQRLIQADGVELEASCRSFADSVAAIGDLDGNGVVDIAVGLMHEGHGSKFAGAVWVLFLESDGSVKAHSRINTVEGGFRGVLASDAFGSALAGMPDLDGNGTRDLMVGAEGANDGTFNTGDVWVLSLDTGFVAPGPIGTRFCPAVPNSTGQTGHLDVIGSESVDDDDLVLVASDLLDAGLNVGYFIMGTGTNTFVPPGAAGPICVSPGLKRFRPPIHTTRDLCGGFSRRVDTSGPVSSFITPGSTWNFQAWHRDSPSPSNFTDAVSVTFR